MQKNTTGVGTAWVVNGLRRMVGGVAFALTLGTAGFAGAHGGDPGSFTTRSVSPVQRLAIEEQYGVSILGVRMTAAGHMLDFRYRVVDPTKAGRLIRPKMGLVLIEQASKAEMSVPVMEKVGALQQTRSHLLPDRTYSVLFANRGGIVKAGSTVSIRFGELTLDNLIVE